MLTATNPFTYGKPISTPDRFYNRKHEIAQVFSRLRNAEFESSAIAGERRVGKTSLLKYLMHPDVRQMYGLDPDQYLFVYVDLEMLNKEATPTQLCRRLLNLLASHCPDPDIGQTLKSSAQNDFLDSFELADLFDSIDERGLHVILLLDEFENVTSNPHFEQDFFYGMRGLAIHHQVALITSSCRELVELCHSDSISASPFFNIFANINLRPFTRPEAEAFILNTLAHTDVHFSADDMDLILRISGCHPYFLQVAGHFLFDAYSRSNNFMSSDILYEVCQNFREEATPHFDRYWSTSLDQEKIVLTILALVYEQQRKLARLSFDLNQLQEELSTHYTRTLFHLEKRSLIMGKDPDYTLFSSAFSRWICDEITNTMHDPQSYETWLNDHQRSFDRLGRSIKNELGDVLPKIGSRYRNLFIEWASNPASWTLLAGGLLKLLL